MPVEHQKPAHGFFHDAEIGAKARQEGREGSTAKRRDHERHAEPERIDREQAGAMGDRRPPMPAIARIAARIGPMHGVQPNANAKPHHIGAPQADRFRHRRAASRCIRNAIGVMPRKCSPMTMMTTPATIAELVRIGAQHRADHAGAGAERHEHRGEAEHEQQRRDDGLAPHPRLRSPRRQTVPATCRPDRPDRAAPAAARRATGSSACPRAAPRISRRSP